MDNEKPDTLWLDEYNIRHAHARAFLLAYSICGNVSRASRCAEWTRARHYQMLTEPTPDALAYADAFLEAQRRAFDVLEGAAQDRAVFGAPRPIYQNGRKVGEERVYSDALLSLLLKANNRAKYGDKQELTGPGGGPLILAQLSQDELDAKIAQLLGSAPPPQMLPAGAAPAQRIELQAPAAGIAQVAAPEQVSVDLQNANPDLQNANKKMGAGPMRAGGVPAPPADAPDSGSHKDGSHPA